MRLPRRAIPLALCAGLLIGGIILFRVTAADTNNKKAPPPSTEGPSIQLILDQQQVIGWITGPKSFAGEKVAITQGEAQSKLEIAKDNTFRIKYDVKKPTPLTAALGTLKASTQLLPKSKPTPTVFFVVDRPIYRENQELKFVGFLRALDDRGQFTPLENQAVKLQLRSKKKNLIAHKMSLTSDEQGRIQGTYRFSSADTLGDYELVIPNYEGEANFKLAAYRKTKVHIKVTGEVEKDKVRIKLDVKDYLGQPLPAKRAAIQVQIVEKAEPRKQPLDSLQFSGHSPKGYDFLALDLTEEEKLLWDAGLSFMPEPAPLWDAFAGTFKLTVDMKGKPEAEVTRKLPLAMLQGGFQLQIDALILDENQRQHSVSTVVPLREKQKAETVEVKVDRRFYAPNEVIKVQRKIKNQKATSTLIAVRLTPHLKTMPREFPQPWNWDFNGIGGIGGDGLNFGFRPGDVQLAQFGEDGFAIPGRALDWSGKPVLPLVVPPRGLQAAALQRIEAAVPFKGDVAELKLTTPGPYRLVVLTRLPDGKQIRSQTVCVVQKAEAIPSAELELDRKLLNQEEAITGTIRMRRRGSHVLLTLRDETGIRWAKPITIEGTALTLKESLPNNAGYGCVLAVHYLDKANELKIVSKRIHVRPGERSLEIKAEHQQRYKPGEMATLNLSVNTNEPTDLVVQVYDKALLRVTSDQTPDVGDFYLANESAFEREAWEYLRRRLGNLTLRDLVLKAKKLVKKATKDSPEGIFLEKLAGANEKSTEKFSLYGARCVMLLRLADIEARDCLVPFGVESSVNVRMKSRVIDVIRACRSQLSLSLDGDVVVMHDRQGLLVAAKMGYWPSQGINGFGAFRGIGGFAGFGGFQGGVNLGVMGFRGGIAGVAGIGGGGFGGIGGIGGVGGIGGGGGILGGGDDGGLGGGGIKGEPGVEAPVPGTLNLRQNFADAVIFQTVRAIGGKASIQFKVPDTLTDWHVKVIGTTSKMRVGQTTSTFKTHKSIMLWPMLPRGFSEGETVKFFAVLTNNTDKAQKATARIKVENGRILNKAEQTMMLKPNEKKKVFWEYQAGKASVTGEGETEILMTVDCDGGSDSALKRLPVLSLSQPQRWTLAGLCESNATFEIPKSIDLRTAKLEIGLAPSMTEDLIDTLNYLLEYPHGCVEQTMSRFLPAIKVAQMLQTLDIKHEELNKKLPRYVDGGIKRLLQLQSSDGGWAWQGNGMTHEMMTPYALYGLMEARKADYHIPDERALIRGKQRLEMFINKMTEKQATDRVYCMYVLCQEQPMKKDWWDFIDKLVGKLSDQALGMGLELAVKENKPKLADRIAKRLQMRAKKEGAQVYWETAGFSRWGDNPIEVTAVVFQALLAHDSDNALLPGVIHYFQATKRGNRWQSTKDTAMVVQALCKYLVTKKIKTKAPEATTLSLNEGKQQSVKHKIGSFARLTIPGSELKHGKNALRFLKGTEGVLYRLVLHYREPGKEPEAVNRGMKVERSFFVMRKGQRHYLKSGDTVKVGDTLHCMLSVSWKKNDQFGYLLLRSPKPSGSEIITHSLGVGFEEHSRAQLREDKDHVILWHFESAWSGFRQLCAYHIEMEGEFLIPSASAELMYRPEVYGHSDAFLLKVAK